MDKFTEDLLTALKVPQIQRRIKEIVTEDNKITELLETGDKKQLPDQILYLTQALNNEKEKRAHMEQEKEYLEKELQLIEKDRKVLRRDNECFLENYGTLNDHYQSYISLGKEIHKELSRVLSTASPDQFLCWGSQWGNIEALWQFMDISLVQNRHGLETIEVLRDIFDYLFELYSNATGNYERISTAVGDIFDEECHKRFGESRVSGRITQVLLQGYRGVYNKKIQKSIVRI